MVGHGFPDGVVGGYGQTVLIEVKDGEKVPSKQKLTHDEERWHSDFLGWVEIVRNEADVERVCNEVIRRGVRSI